MLYNANTPFTSSHNKNKLCFKQMKQPGCWVLGKIYREVSLICLSSELKGEKNQEHLNSWSCTIFILPSKTAKDFTWFGMSMSLWTDEK